MHENTIPLICVGIILIFLTFHITRYSSTPPPCDQVCCVVECGWYETGWDHSDCTPSTIHSVFNYVRPPQPPHTCRVDTVEVMEVGHKHDPHWPVACKKDTIGNLIVDTCFHDKAGE